LLVENTIPGITLEWENNEDEAHLAYRVGNVIILNVSVFVKGTYTGTTNWIDLFNLPTSLLKPGERFHHTPTSIIAGINFINGDTERIVRARQMTFVNGDTYNSYLDYQCIISITK